MHKLLSEPCAQIVQPVTPLQLASGGSPSSEARVSHVSGWCWKQMR